MLNISVMEPFQPIIHYQLHAGLLRKEWKLGYRDLFWIFHQRSEIDTVLKNIFQDFFSFTWKRRLILELLLSILLNFRR